MSTEASFIRTTNNDVPLTISSSSVFIKSIKSIFFVPKEMLLPKEGFADAGKLWKYAFNFSYFNSEKMRHTYQSKIAFSWNSFLFPFSFV